MTYAERLEVMAREAEEKAIGLAKLTRAHSPEPSEAEVEHRARAAALRAGARALREPTDEDVEQLIGVASAASNISAPAYLWRAFTRAVLTALRSGR